MAVISPKWPFAYLSRCCVVAFMSAPVAALANASPATLDDPSLIEQPNAPQYSPYAEPALVAQPNLVSPDAAELSAAQRANSTEVPLQEPTMPLPAETTPPAKAVELPVAEGTPVEPSAVDANIIYLDIESHGSPATIMHPLQLGEAASLALKNNFEARASKSKLKSVYLEKLTAYSLYLPAVDVNIARGNEKSEPASYNDLFGNRVMYDSHTRYDRVYSVRQPIIDLAIIGDILVAGKTEDVAVQEDREVCEGIVYDTINAYMRLLQARLAVELADQYRSYLDELSSRMEARVEGGGATLGDLERIKGRSTQAEAARIEALGDYESNLSEFKRLTQVTPAQLVLPQVSPQVPEDIAQAMESALRNNPSYLASQMKVDVATSSRNSTMAKLAPKLGLEYSNIHVWNAGGSANGNPVDGVYPNQDDERVMLVGRWSMNGGLEVMQSATALEKINEAQFREMDSRERIEQGIRTSYHAINAAELRLAVLQKSVESNATVVREFEDQYHNGSRSVFELLDAYEQLYIARLNLMRLGIARELAAYQVHRQMGGLINQLLNDDKQANG